MALYDTDISFKPKTIDSLPERISFLKVTIDQGIVDMAPELRVVFWS